MDSIWLNPQLRYARQICLFQPLKIDVFVQVKSFFPAIAPQLLNELSSHPGPEDVSTISVAAAVR
ncbi:MAG: hypothetical protein WA137_00095 [Methanothrix sp.]